MVVYCRSKTNVDLGEKVKLNNLNLDNTFIFYLILQNFLYKFQ